MPANMTLKNLLNQILVSKKILRFISIAVIPALIFYGVSLFVLQLEGYKIIQIIRDPAQQSGASSLLGFLSNIGIWLWISSAAISFFFAFSNTIYEKKKLKELLFLTGMLSLLLAVDDFFMIHDRYVNERICFLTYAIILGSLFIRHIKIIVAIDGFAFLCAGFFLGSSIFIDLTWLHLHMSYEYSQVIEEGFKFLGAATWLYFNFRVASSILVPEKEK